MSINKQERHFIQYFPYYFDARKSFNGCGYFEDTEADKYRNYKHLFTDDKNYSIEHPDEFGQYQFYSTYQPKDQFWENDNSIISYSNNNQHYQLPTQLNQNYITRKVYNQHYTNFDFQYPMPHKYTSGNQQYQSNDHKNQISTSNTIPNLYFQETNHKYYEIPHHPKSSKPSHSLSKEDYQRQKIARSNHQYVRNNPNAIDHSIENIDESYHSQIAKKVTRPIPTHCNIIITRFSTIDTAIYYHNLGYGRICLLNFADAKKPGGGYLNGRNAQEECLCRQTLLYPTLMESQMYKSYEIENDLYKSDFMTYSPNVYVIRDNSNSMLEIPFKVDIISAPAVDNRKKVNKANLIMERRIRKIVKLAAFKKNKVLVLGAFGCGVFKNNPRDVSHCFKKVLIDEGLKDYFKLVVFPIYKDEQCKKIFEKELL